ncbi:MAG: CCA tRNA nucleotidyltransferase [Bacteroidetes bacterium]|nr:CCA tRNA nucleotidyltransferase [Bacteroidota bacterium]MBU1114984.1 CCA tRNA nucleotidyltransferase [Bacteroidota bacterium]MBU1797514.1 CCA tRNA nucleotidyltransferase [Bacteroidota bacterium]
MIDFKKYISEKDYFIVASEIADEMKVNIFVVGGYVRDLILDRKLYDVDILVVPKEKNQIDIGLDFANKLAKKLKVKDVSFFKTFGTAHFLYNNIDLEFVGARKESYSHESRNPEVAVGTFDDDINRRDFTINTLAISLNKENFGKLVDKFDGLKDIESKLIKTPLDANITFNDDPLRIMRAFRFASQLNFILDNSIMEAASKLANRLEIISQERITDEFFKILASPKPSVGLKLLYDSQVMKVVFPEVADLGGVEQRNDFHHKDVFLHTCQVVDNIAKVSDNVWLRFAGLMHDIAKPPTKKFDPKVGWTFHGHEEKGSRWMKYIFNRMKLPLSKLNYVRNLVRLHLRPIALISDTVTDSAIRRFIVTIGEDLEDMITLCRADITSKNQSKVTRYLSNYDKVMEKVRDVKERDKLREFQSPVHGDEIMAIFNIPPSRKVGEIKTAIEEAILDGEIGNNYEEALKYLMKIKDKFE